MWDRAILETADYFDLNMNVRIWLDIGAAEVYVDAEKLVDFEYVGHIMSILPIARKESYKSILKIRNPVFLSYL
jgi:hypothetical protein